MTVVDYAIGEVQPAMFRLSPTYLECVCVQRRDQSASCRLRAKFDPGFQKRLFLRQGIEVDTFGFFSVGNPVHIRPVRQ